jgi:hypothetical protein
MKVIPPIVAALALLIFAPVLQAVVSVNSMNFPAWVERGDSAVPLAPGDSLRTGDIVVTGGRGRVWLAAEDGSAIKLGQGTRFVIERAALAESDAGSVFTAVFDVLKGAFRFSSGFFSARHEFAHQVDVRIGAITAGVRGTDIWGRSSDDEDLVALIEGSIEVASDGAAPQRMDKPLTIYRKTTGRLADGIRPVEPEIVGEYAIETELAERAGIASAGGDYELVLASVRAERFDAAELERFRHAGYPVRTAGAMIDGVEYTRTVLGGLIDLQAATNLRRRIAAEFGIDDAWIRSGG